MFGLPVLEVAIGLSFVYLLLALVCTTLNETIAGITSRRADVLQEGIRSLLGHDLDLTSQLMKHPLIASLARKLNSAPSYIPASRFALALMDILTGEGKAADDAQALRAGLATLKSAGLRTTLSTVLADASPKLAADQQKIEAWFEEGMDRVSGWYKRRTTLWVWILAAAVTLGLDADSLRIANILWTNQAVRAAVVESAKTRAQGERPEGMIPLAVHTNPNDPKAAVAVLPHNNDALTKEERSELSDFTGWQADKTWGTGSEFYISLLQHLLGWLFTIAAVSLGAPFWFDTLNRFVNIRSAGRAPDEPRDKSSTAPTT